MARYEFHLPDIGEGLAEAEVGKWLVSIGDHVREDQPVVEMMTDKATVELPAPSAGVMVEQRASEGDIVKTGSVLYVLATDSESEAPVAEEHETSANARPPFAKVAAPAEPAKTVLAPPAVRKLAREMGVDLAKVKGTGPGGRISAEDVQRHTSASTRTPSAQSQILGGQRIRLHGIRKRMAETMTVSARSIPQVTGFHELDATAFIEFTSGIRREAESRGVRFPFDAFLVRAAAVALRRHPVFNASLDEEHDEIVMHEEVNIGVATATPEGLIVPVVKRADTLRLDALAAEVDRVTRAARERRLAPADLLNGTFTISNTGAWRGSFGTSLIRPPEVALVAFGRIETKPVVRAGTVLARPVMPMSVTFDHRLIDGEQGLTFALTMRSLIEEPTQLIGD